MKREWLDYVYWMREWIMPSRREWYQMILLSGWDIRISRMDCLLGTIIDSKKGLSSGQDNRILRINCL